MSVSGLLLRFTGIYVTLFGLVIAFGLVGHEPSSNVGGLILMGAVVAAYVWFASENKRDLEPREAHRIPGHVGH